MVSSILSPLSILLSHPPIPPFISGNLCMNWKRAKRKLSSLVCPVSSPISLRTERETERHYQVVFYLVFKLMGQFTQAEVRTAIGRADAVVKTADYIYVFEFKLTGTAEEALKQIDEKVTFCPTPWMAGDW